MNFKRIAVFFLIFLAIFSLFYFYGMVWQAKLLSHAEPVKAGLRAHIVQKGFHLRHGVVYYPFIRYKYEIKGSFYYSDRIRTPMSPWRFVFPLFWQREDLHFPTRPAAKEYNRKYNLNKPVQALVNPDFPDDAFTERHADYAPMQILGHYVIASIPLLLLAVIIDALLRFRLPPSRRQRRRAALAARAAASGEAPKLDGIR